MEKGKLLLYETSSNEHIFNLIKVFEKYSDDFNLSTRKAKRINKKIIFRISARVDAETEHNIREEVAALNKPFATSFLFDSVR